MGVKWNWSVDYISRLMSGISRWLICDVRMHIPRWQIRFGWGCLYYLVLIRMVLVLIGIYYIK